MSDAVARAGTVEARWFGAGALPSALAAWFERAGGSTEAPRTDRYLQLPGVEAVGVKWRAGRFELKARRARPAATVVWQATPSPLEAWLKWSAPTAPCGDDLVPPLDVGKARRLLTQDGVQVELAALEVAGRRFWTFGPEGERADRVEAVLASPWVAAAPPVPVAFAGGYPAWLARVASAGAASG